ncbi:MAG: phosphoribosylamine--glycine ligase [Bacteroidota bacterium]
MNVLLIGGGGREHALAWKISESPVLKKLFCTPGNPGIFEIAEKAEIDLNGVEIVEFCREHKISLVVIGPDKEIADGLADTLCNARIPVFGPSRKAARLEWSKGFAKEFMDRHNIPTAGYARFKSNETELAWRYLAAQDFPVVIKADGLAAGKGVTVAYDNDTAFGALDEIFNGKFGAAGAEVVIEDFLKGEEASVFAICDGRRFVTLAPAQDHKRAFDNDEGKNTGGMGSYAPAAIVTPDVLKKVEERIIAPVLKGMADEGATFVGCLFVGLMIDNGEPSVVEFNARFGDPETQSVLTVFKGDFLRLLHSAAMKNIDSYWIKEVADGVACTVVLASKGYPDAFEKGFPITGLENAQSENVRIFHAGTTLKEDKLVTNGGRVLGVTAKSETLEDAIATAYKAVNKVCFDNIFYRKDIGKKGLAIVQNEL